MEDDDEHTAVADSKSAQLLSLCHWSLRPLAERHIFLDLVGRVSFAELRPLKRIAEALRQFFEPRRTAGKFVFGVGR